MTITSHHFNFRRIESCQSSNSPGTSNSLHHTVMMQGDCEPKVLHISRNYIDSIDIDSTGTKLILGISSLAGNTWDGGLTLLSTNTSDEILKYSPAGISTVRFSGSNLILAARDDGTVAVYSAVDLHEIQVFNAHDDVVSCVADSPWSESHFGSCSWDGSIHMWDWQSKAKPVSSYFSAHQGHVNAISFSPFDPQVFISVGWDGYARQWDRRVNPSSGLSSSVQMDQISSCVTYDSADANTFLVGTDAGDISVCDLRALDSPSAKVSTVRIHKGRVRRILTSPAKSSVFVSASDDTTYATCSIEHGSLLEKSRFTQHSDYVTDIAWTIRTSHGECGLKNSTGPTDIIYSASTDKSLIANETNLDMPSYTKT